MMAHQRSLKLSPVSPSSLFDYQRIELVVAGALALAGKETRLWRRESVDTTDLVSSAAPPEMEVRRDGRSRVRLAVRLLLRGDLCGVCKMERLGDSCSGCAKAAYCA